MESRFYAGEEEEYGGGGLGALTGSLYYWSTLSMFAGFHDKGEYYLPWSGMVKPGGMRVSAVGKKWGIRAATAEDLRDPMSKLIGKKWAGMGGVGTAQLIGSRLTSGIIGTMIWTDPVFFAFNMIGKSAAAKWSLGLTGVAWFGAGALVHGAARAMERTRYVDMNQAFPESQQSFTSRQRAVRAISESQLQARSAIGNEAQLFHR